MKIDIVIGHNVYIQESTMYPPQIAGTSIYLETCVCTHM